MEWRHVDACDSEVKLKAQVFHPLPHSHLFYPQALRSFKLSVTVDPKYHPKIIGRKGAVITQIRLEHDVNIQFPDKDDGNQVRDLLGQIAHWCTLGADGLSLMFVLTGKSDQVNRSCSAGR